VNTQTGVQYDDCNGKTSGQSCTPTKDLAVCAAASLACFANGTYDADTTCLDTCAAFTCVSGSSTNAANAASTDFSQENCCTADPTTQPGDTNPPAATTVQITGYFPLSGTFNCSTNTSDLNLYFGEFQAQVEATFQGTLLGNRTWTWIPSADLTRLSYSSDSWEEPPLKSDVLAAFEATWATGGAAEVVATPKLAACGIAAGAPVDTTPTQPGTPGATDPAGGPDGDSTATPSDIDPAASAMIGVFSVMFAVIAQLV